MADGLESGPAAGIVLQVPIGAGNFDDEEPMTAALPLGLQLYSIKDQCAADFPGSLEKVAQMGYDGVEFAGYYGRSAPELRALLDRLHLRCCGTHTGLETLAAERIQATCEFSLTLANAYLVVPWIAAERMDSVAKIAQIAKLFNEAAAVAGPMGLKVGYHAHAHDFHQVEGKSAWARLGEAVGSEVFMQMDTHNCIQGGADPLTELRRFPGRAYTVHVKEYPTGVAPGRGQIDFRPLIDYCRGPGQSQWLIVEHEEASQPPMEVVAEARGFFEKFLK